MQYRLGPQVTIIVGAAPLVPYLVEELPHDELHIHIAFDRRGRVDHLEMAGEGQDGVGASVAFSARRPKL